MDVKFLGMKFNVVTALIALLLGIMIGGFMLCSCANVTIKEGYDLRGAPLDWSLSHGVPGDRWDAPAVTAAQANDNMYAPLSGNTGGKVPLPDNQLFMFYDNKFKPECCYKPQQYSSSTGCACISEEQMRYISSRGSNNTLP